MNYDVIENLSNEQLMDLYQETIESDNDNDLIGYKVTLYYYVVCADGRTQGASSGYNASSTETCRYLAINTSRAQDCSQTSYTTWRTSVAVCGKCSAGDRLYITGCRDL